MDKGELMALICEGLQSEGCIEWCRTRFCFCDEVKNIADHLLANAAYDTAPVVRCKHCKYISEKPHMIRHCVLTGLTPDDDDFAPTEKGKKNERL